MAPIIQTVRAPGEHGWQVSVTSPDGAVNFVAGPATPPLGTGSARLFTGTNGDLSAELRQTRFNPMWLRDLLDLRYWTYDVQNNGQQWPYIILQIDFTNDGTIDDLIFIEPAFQNPAAGSPCLPDQGVPVLNTWQQWNAYIGGWWSLNGFGGATPGTGVKSLFDYLNAVPGAKIIPSPGGLGGIRVLHGFASPSDVFEGFVDAVLIRARGVTNTVIYDFEPTV